MNLPQPFLEQRRECLILAAERVYFGDPRPIPQMSAWPGIYTPPAQIRVDKIVGLQDSQVTRLKPRKEHVKRARLCRVSRSICRGDLQPGTEVVSGTHTGKVIGFVPANSDPLALLPPGTRRTEQAGRIIHKPHHIARYCVVVVDSSGKTIYHFPKATTLEKQVGECKPS